MNSNILGEKDGFLIRLAKAEDAAGYFEQKLLSFGSRSSTFNRLQGRIYKRLK